NSFSLNQAALVLENAPKPEAGKRWGARLDLQWGQATQTLQGNAANEPRPDIYRNIFQAYGTYVAPLGSGLTLDFGKWASSLGYEGNYSKDQINYSRAFWFSFLPFYHMGLRANYNINDRFGVHYWITNGTQQTEAFNEFKDESAGLSWQPRKSINWTLNYYVGQEHPDTVYYPNGAPSNLGSLPAQQGVPFMPIPNPPRGKLHIWDTYATWQASPALMFVGEADWVLEREYTNSRPAHASGGALYARYQVNPKWAIAARAEYLSDRGGLFSGTTQALKETTFTGEYKIADGFLARLEFRRDFSNQPYFYSSVLNRLKREQNTAGIGLIWWFGGKEGSW
ncbi:MAG: porin, partial [Acidobacteriaceae bacterium]|nr:porin [Acidobacteriaceae bacterium]